jgi:uncharacterized membrane protein
MVKDLIPGAALLFAVLCFALYVVLTLAPLRLARKEYSERQAKSAANKELAPPGIGFADLVTAFAALVEGLAKAGPALWALIGSMLFLLIAGFAAGVFTTA